MTSSPPAHRVAINFDLHTQEQVAASDGFPFDLQAGLTIDGRPIDHVSSVEAKMVRGEPELVVRFAEHMTEDEARSCSETLRTAIVTSIRALRRFPFVRIESPFLRA